MKIDETEVKLFRHSPVPAAMRKQSSRVKPWREQARLQHGWAVLKCLCLCVTQPTVFVRCVRLRNEFIYL